MITNGTILSDEMFEFYKKLGSKINIRISVDGYKSDQDITRKTKNMEGSWALLEKNLSSFTKLKEKYDVKVTLTITINKSTCRNIYHNFTKLYELTGMTVGTLFVHDDHWEKDDFEAIRDRASSLAKLQHEK